MTEKNRRGAIVAGVRSVAAYKTGFRPGWITCGLPVIRTELMPGAGNTSYKPTSRYKSVRDERIGDNALTENHHEPDSRLLDRNPFLDDFLFATIRRVYGLREHIVLRFLSVRLITQRCDSAGPKKATYDFVIARSRERSKNAS
jgi:hypothetical protein